MALRTVVVCTLVGTWLAAQPVAAQSIGFHNLPCTVPQYIGHGFGAGHHAPLIRTTHCRPPRMPRYVRVPDCGVYAALPASAFPLSSGPGYHTQLDRLLRSGDDDVLPVTPTESVPPVPVTTNQQAPHNPPIPTLPEP